MHAGAHLSYLSYLPRELHIELSRYGHCSFPVDPPYYSPTHRAWIITIHLPSTSTHERIPIEILISRTNVERMAAFLDAVQAGRVNYGYRVRNVGLFVERTGSFRIVIQEDGTRTVFRDIPMCYELEERIRDAMDRWSEKGRG
jgi:hypothetical protein